MMPEVDSPSPINEPPTHPSSRRHLNDSTTRPAVFSADTRHQLQHRSKVNNHHHDDSQNGDGSCGPQQRPFTAPPPPPPPTPSSSSSRRTSSVPPAADLTMLNMINQLPVQLSAQITTTHHDHHLHHHLTMPHHMHGHHPHLSPHPHQQQHYSHPAPHPMYQQQQRSVAAPIKPDIHPMTGHITVQLQSLHCGPAAAAPSPPNDAEQPLTTFACHTTAAERLSCWHPHVYAKSPRSPTPHSIVDILGIARHTPFDADGESTVVNNADHGATTAGDDVGGAVRSSLATINAILNAKPGRPVTATAEPMDEDRPFFRSHIGAYHQPAVADRAGAMAYGSETSSTGSDQPLNLCMAKTPEQQQQQQRLTSPQPRKGEIRRKKSFMFILLTFQTNICIPIHRALRTQRLPTETQVLRRHLLGVLLPCAGP